MIQTRHWGGDVPNTTCRNYGGHSEAIEIKRSASPSILAELIFDDRGHAMSPSHANKNGVRHPYYVSQALLQSRKDEAGSVPRVSAPGCIATCRRWMSFCATLRPMLNRCRYVLETACIEA